MQPIRHATPRRRSALAGLCLTLGLAATATSPAPARAEWIAVNDGGTHVYGANSGHEWDALLIRDAGCPYPPGGPCASPGTPTTAIVRPGAEIYMVQGRDTSNVVVNGGDLGFLRAYEDAHVTMHDGRVHDAWTSLTLASSVIAQDRSTLVVAGGFIDGPLSGHGTSTVTIEGGHVTAQVGSGGSGRLTLNGGRVDAYVGARDDARVTVNGGSMDWLLASDWSGVVVTGGTIDSSVHARDDSQVWIVGSDFAIDGVPVGLGDLVATSGILTGVLENGDALSVAFRQGELDTGQLLPYTGTITLTPEPGSGLLLGLGLAWLGATRRGAAEPSRDRR